VRHKEPWLSGFSLTQQPKREALSLKGVKKGRPAAWPSALLAKHCFAAAAKTRPALAGLKQFPPSSAL